MRMSLGFLILVVDFILDTSGRWVCKMRGLSVCLGNLWGRGVRGK